MHYLIKNMNTIPTLSPSLSPENSFGPSPANPAPQRQPLVYSLAVTGAIVATAALLHAFAHTTAPADPRVSVQTIPVVEVQPATSLDATFTGTIEARVLSPMAFRVSGKVIKRYVDKGQSVKKGDALMSLDATDFALSATVANQQLQASQAIDNQAQADHSRFAAVVGAGAVSQQRYDAAKATAGASAANVLAAQAQHEIADNANRYTTIYAEADGVIVDTLAEPGQVVQAGQVVVKLAFSDTREAVIDLPESYVLNSETTATAYLGDDESIPFKAHLRQLAAQADPILRTFEARFPLDENPAVARLGATVTMRLSHKSNAFQVPLGALVNRGQGYTVWVFDPKTSTVSEQSINVERLTENDAIVSTGLNLGEQVVSAGAHRLFSGQKINASIN